MVRVNTPPADFLLRQDNWEVFSQSLVEALEAQLRPGPDGAGQMLLITAPAPVVTEPAAAPRGLRATVRRLAGKSPLQPSPEVPGIVVVGQSQGAQLTVPFLDEQGRALLDPQHITRLTNASWVKQADVLQTTVTSAQLGATVVGVLIEVLQVPHPADVEYLFHSLQ